MTDAQHVRLVELMKANFVFISGRHPSISGPQSKQDMWNMIARECNAVDREHEKTVDGWKRVSKV